MTTRVNTPGEAGPRTRGLEFITTGDWWSFSIIPTMSQPSSSSSQTFAAPGPRSPSPSELPMPPFPVTARYPRGGYSSQHDTSPDMVLTRMDQTLYDRRDVVPRGGAPYPTREEVWFLPCNRLMITKKVPFLVGCPLRTG